MTLAVALPNWVGDAVMATPALRALRSRFPGERLVAVVRPYIRPVLDPNPWTDEFIEMPKSAAGVWRAARQLCCQRAAVGVLLANSARAALVFYLGRVQRRVGYDRDARGLFLTDRVPAAKEGSEFVPTPQITAYLKLAEAVGAPAGDVRLELFATAEDEAAARAAYEAAGLSPARTLLLCPGAAFGPSKGWPAPHWAALARLARDKFDLEPAILCGPSEAGDAQAILAEAGGRCATFHDKGITLASARAVVKAARAMVAIDSGLRHYAAAFDKPVVALFGPTDIRWTETWHRKEVRLQGLVPCGPCQQPICPSGTTECMWKITPQEALDALAEALRRDQARTA